MNKDELFAKFRELFPSWKECVVSYKKMGSKCLVVKTQTTSLVFLYYGPDNWQFGTKLWRKRPEKIEKKEESQNGMVKKHGKLDRKQNGENGNYDEEKQS